MQSLEDVFVKEFKNSIIVENKDIYRVPLPKVCDSWEVSGTEVYAVRGIEGVYIGLNKTLVKKVPKNFEVKRRVIDKVTRSFKTENGSFVYEPYTIPSGSIAVTSEVNLGIPYSEYISPTKGYGYVDFVNSKNKLLYIYVLPKDVLYKVNQTALVISVKNMKSFDGMGFVSWRNGTIFINVIPYSPNSQYIGTKVLKTSTSLNYTSEIKEISTYWEKVGFIPNISLCALQNNTNLCLKPSVIGYSEYLPVEQLSLADKEIFKGEE